MREVGGLKVINEAIEKLGKEHDRHIKLYDPTGVSGRREAVHVMNFGPLQQHISHSHTHTHKDGRGYLEDRRPSSNCDPYLVAEALVRSTCLDWENFEMEGFAPKN